MKIARKHARGLKAIARLVINHDIIQDDEIAQALTQEGIEMSAAAICVTAGHLREAIQTLTAYDLWSKPK